MKGTDILDLLPCGHSQEREDAILDAVRAGSYVEVCWYPVRTEFNGHVGVILVSADTLKLGEPDDYFRPNVTAATAQRIADELNCILPTTLICDKVWEQASAHASPCLQPADPAVRKAAGYPTCPDGSTSMSDTPAMLRHSKEVSAKRAGQAGLLCNVGKHWVITNRLLNKSPETAANYGWFDESAPHASASGLKLWQPLSTAHNDAHTDYSQVQSRLVSTRMLVDGEPRSIFDVGRDPELCGLVSSEGIVKVWRQRSVPPPGEPQPPPTDPLPPDTPPLEFDRLLKLTSPWTTGEDVRAWQRFLRISPDGKFGPQTDSATRAFQSTHRDPATGRTLLVDGIVGPATTRAANEVLRERSENHDGYPGPLVDDYVQARNFTDTDRSAYIKHIVIHTAEIAEVFTAAEALAAWVSGNNAPKASWHYCVAPETRILCADLVWRRACELTAGVRLLGTQESLDQQRRGQTRTLQECVIRAVARRVAPRLRLQISDGREVVCSTDHRWLAMNRKRKVFNWCGSWQWTAACELQPGDAICCPFTPWGPGRGYDWGYLGGILDGEGTWHTASTAQVEFSQKDGPVLRRALRVLDTYGITYNVQARPNGVNVVLISGINATLELLGRSRPDRLLEGSRYLGRALRSRTYETRVFVASVDAIDEGDVVSLETSSHTYFAEGMVSHNCIDADSTIQNLYDELIAWHAPGANRTGIGIELAGRAKQTAEDWADEFSRDTLARAARLVAYLCVKWNIPPEFVDRDGLKRGDAGVTTHNEVTFAFGKTDHTDPGKAFPMDDFLAQVVGFCGG